MGDKFMRKLISIILILIILLSNCFAGIKYTNCKLGAFQPSQISGCIVWLDAEDISTITLNGATVSKWDDKSGEDNHVAQATADNQPVYRAPGGVGINGKASFDYHNDNLKSDVFAGGPVNQPDTVFLVIQYDSVGGFPHPFDGRTSGEQYYSISSSPYYFRISAGSLVGGGIASINTPYIYEAIFNEANSSIIINGNVTGTGNSGTNSLTGVTIGGAYNGSFDLNGKIGEVIVYDRALTESERNQVENYLSIKWGISLS